MTKTKNAGKSSKKPANMKTKNRMTASEWRSCRVPIAEYEKKVAAAEAEGKFLAKFVLGKFGTKKTLRELKKERELQLKKDAVLEKGNGPKFEALEDELDEQSLNLDAFTQRSGEQAGASRHRIVAPGIQPCQGDDEDDDDIIDLTGEDDVTTPWEV